jgi:aldehyde:ferredoxin oxidoreductase
MMCVMDSLKMCKFPFANTAIADILTWLNGITGWDVTKEELLETGERIFNLKRVYNIACGVTGKDDTIPERILREPRGSGGSADSLPVLEIQLEEYYRVRKWSSEGIPLPKTLSALGLEKFIPFVEQ